MKHRWHLGIALLALSLPGRLAFAGDGPALGAHLNELLDYARSHHPQLIAFHQETEALASDAQAADALPDPQVQIELMDITNAMADAPPSLLPGAVGETRYRVMQPVPYPGKRQARRDLADLATARAERDQHAATLALLTSLKQVQARRYQVQQQQTWLEDSLRWLDAIIRTAEQRYSVGLSDQTAILDAQAERHRLQLEQWDLRGEQTALDTQLNSLLGRPANTPLEAAQPLPWPASLPTLDVLIAQAENTAPDLAGERVGLAMAAQAERVQRLERYPDFALGIAHERPRAGRASWGVMLEVSVPLQQAARRSREHASEHRRQAAEQRVRASQLSLAGEIGRWHAQVSSNLGKARLIREQLLPANLAQRAAAQAQYTSNQGDISAVMAAHRA
ncbi:MAG: TolC family protein, partial [Gammaproteobacteria bacterium]|nr:TolC family protein [Gammaproteobacteria bacterium]